MEYLFLFHNPNKSRFCGGVFSQKAKAEAWIFKHNLTGVLTKYPLDNGVYDWAIENKFLIVKKENQREPNFIGGFSTAAQEHYHYENGLLVS